MRISDFSGATLEPSFGISEQRIVNPFLAQKNVVKIDGTTPYFSVFFRIILSRLLYGLFSYTIHKVQRFQLLVATAKIDLGIRRSIHLSYRGNLMIFNNYYFLVFPVNPFSLSFPI